MGSCPIHFRIQDLDSYLAGAEAQEDGATLEDNPFPLETINSEAWEVGWLDNDTFKRVWKERVGEP